MTTGNLSYKGVEDVPDVPNINAPINIMRRIHMITAWAIPCGFLFYILVAYLIMDSSELKMSNFGIHRMGLKFNFYNGSVSPDGYLSHQIILKKVGNIQAYRHLATYTLSTGRLIGNNMLTAVSTSTFSISEDVQNITVKFEAIQTGLAEEDIKDFKKRLENGQVWVTLHGDFLWKTRVLVFPHLYKSVYFKCMTPYIATSDNVQFGKCAFY